MEGLKVLYKLVPYEWFTDVRFRRDRESMSLLEQL